MVDKKLKIVLITTGQPSCNPRIVKEADAFVNAGFDVVVLYCFFIRWASEKDEVLLKKVVWRYKMVGGSPYTNRLLYFFTRLRFKLATILSRNFRLKFILAERTQARAYDELLRAAKRIKADWYIGHNLGALAVSVKAAQYNRAKCGFDFEDYHRGEYREKNHSDIGRISYLENKYLPYLNYYSTASNLITEATKANHPYFDGRIITLLNTFPIAQLPTLHLKDKEDKTLKLFWFSQTIGKGRGIESVLKALLLLDNSNISLTLAGRCNEDMRLLVEKKLVNSSCKVFFAGIIQPEELPKFASNFDIGLALEPVHPFNRDICLTNKVFTYILAGNAVLLSNTSMQNQFNDVYKIGESFDMHDSVTLSAIINSYLNSNKLNTQKKYNYNLAISQLNWDNESKKILEIIV